MANRLAFENLPLIPAVVAWTVCEQEYLGQEISDRIRWQATVNKIETLRQQMTPEQIQEFAELCEIGGARIEQRVQLLGRWVGG